MSPILPCDGGASASGTYWGYGNIIATTNRTFSVTYGPDGWGSPPGNSYRTSGNVGGGTFAVTMSAIGGQPNEDGRLTPWSSGIGVVEQGIQQTDIAPTLLNIDGSTLSPASLVDTQESLQITVAPHLDTPTATTPQSNYTSVWTLDSSSNTVDKADGFYPGLTISQSVPLCGPRTLLVSTCINS